MAIGYFPALGAWAGQSLPRAQTPAEAIAELLANPPRTVPKVEGYPPQRNVPSTGPLAPLYVEGIPADMPVGTQVESPLRPGVDAIPASYRPSFLPSPPTVSPLHGTTFAPPPPIRTAGSLPPSMQNAPFQLSALSAVMGAGRNPNTMPRVPRAPLGQMAPQVSTQTDTGGATMNGQPITLASVLSFLQRPSVRQANSPVMAAMNGNPSNFANPAYIPPGGLANYGGAYQSAFQNGVRDNWDRTQMQADEELRQKRLTGNY